MKTPIILAAIAVALLGTACASDATPDWSEVSTLYSAGADVTCDGPTAITVVSEVEHWCTFREVLVDGQPHCYATVIFERPDVRSPWSVVGIYPTSATCN